MRDYYNEVKSFAGQIARAGAAVVATVSYLNKDEKKIHAGQFVVHAENGCKLASSESDIVIGVVVALGILKEFKPKTNLSVLLANYGDEIWTQANDDAEFKDGDRVYVDITTSNAAKTGIPTNFYVSKVNGNLIKIMRQDVIATSATKKGAQ